MRLDNCTQHAGTGGRQPARGWPNQYSVRCQGCGLWFNIPVVFDGGSE